MIGQSHAVWFIPWWQSRGGFLLFDNTHCLCVPGRSHLAAVHVSFIKLALTLDWRYFAILGMSLTNQKPTEVHRNMLGGGGELLGKKTIISVTSRSPQSRTRFPFKYFDILHLFRSGSLPGYQLLWAEFQTTWHYEHRQPKVLLLTLNALLCLQWTEPNSIVPMKTW